MSIKGITITSDNHEMFFKRSLVLFLENGYTVSVIYGTSAYSFEVPGTPHGRTPTNAGNQVPEASAVEIAVIAPNGDFVPFSSGDTVRGFTDIKTVGEIIAWATELPSTVNS